MPNKSRIKSKSKLEKHSPSCINIFISYAREDKELVASIDSLLRDTFEFAPLNIYRDIEIKEGQNWAKQIDVALQEADILLVIFTDRMKMSHSYTGYEIGYFNRSIQQRRKGSAGFDRIYIPFCIGADVPDTMHDIQGVSIGADEVYKVLKTKIESGSEPVVDEDHPVFKLLARISDLVMQTLGTGNGRAIKIHAHRQTSVCIVSNYSRIFARPGIIRNLSGTQTDYQDVDPTGLRTGRRRLDKIKCRADWRFCRYFQRHHGPDHRSRVYLVGTLRKNTIRTSGQLCRGHPATGYNGAQGRRRQLSRRHDCSARQIVSVVRLQGCDVRQSKNGDSYLRCPNEDQGLWRPCRARGC